MTTLATRLLLAAAAAPLLLAAAEPTGQLRVDLSGMRNAKGELFLCLSANPRHFPDCAADPAARKLRVPAGKAEGLVFDALKPGDYALSIMHDENRNGRFDTTMKIPREGFGFSRNPVVRFGPPAFRDVRFAVPVGASRMPVRMKYFL